MIRDLDERTEDGIIEADLCIIGAGAAGITIAHALRDSGLDVVVLEAGGLEIEDESQAIYEGDVVGLDYYPIDHQASLFRRLDQSLERALHEARSDRFRETGLDSQ